MSPRKTINRTLSLALFGTTFIFAAPLLAATDRHGNEGYSTAAECDAAVAAGSAKFYEAFTEHAPLRRDGEVAVKRGTLSDAGPHYGRGACDLGVGSPQGQDLAAWRAGILKLDGNGHAVGECDEGVHHNSLSNGPMGRLNVSSRLKAR